MGTIEEKKQVLYGIKLVFGWIFGNAWKQFPFIP